MQELNQLAFGNIFSDLQRNNFIYKDDLFTILFAHAWLLFALRLVYSFPPWKIFFLSVNFQPRSQGLLLDDFQNGGSSEEDPGLCWTNTFVDWPIHTNTLIGLNAS